MFAPHAIDVQIKGLKEIRFYSIGTNASNHCSQRLYPLVARYFDNKEGSIQIKLLDFQPVKDETAKTINGLITTILRKPNLSEISVFFFFWVIMRL